MSVEELTAQLDAFRVERDVQVSERDASIVALVEALHARDATIEELKVEVAGLSTQVGDLTKQLGEKEVIVAAYREAVVDQVRKLLK